MKTVLLKIVMILLVTYQPVWAEDLESLAQEGYQVEEQTELVGEFKGCDARTALRFANNKVFICSSYAFSFTVYMPVVYILKNEQGEHKVLINGIAFSGTFLGEKK